MDKPHIRLHYRGKSRWQARIFYSDATQTVSSSTIVGSDVTVMSHLAREFEALNLGRSLEYKAIFGELDGEEYIRRIGGLPKRKL